MSNVRMPIETSREGEKITKVCVEDVYKIINRVMEQMDKSYNNSKEILDSVHKRYWANGDKNVYYEGELLIGTGTSQPCNGDKFDEEIGNEIAFKKMKFNVNNKKYNVLRRVYNQYVDLLNVLEHEMNKVLFYIDYDLDGIREYNPDYLKDCFKEFENESKSNEEEA